MDKITQEFLDELLSTQEKMNALHEELRDYIYEHEKWKTDNLGKAPNHVENEITDICIEDGKLIINTYDRDYDCDCEHYYYTQYSYSLTELMTNDWKEEAMAKRNKELVKGKNRKRNDRKRINTRKRSARTS